MLAANEAKLRWWGIDMRPRWRRRVAVVGTYFVLFVLTGIGVDGRWAEHPYLALVAMVVVTMIWRSVSVFRGNGVVKSFEDPAAGRELMMVNGLDEWALYRFGVKSFEDANEEQKADLLKRYRVGTFLVPTKAAKSGLDERERGERDTAERWALKQMAGYLAIGAGIYVNHAARHEAMRPMETAGIFWMLALFAQTLPQARVLWTEPDPREVMGEMELVEREI